MAVALSSSVALAEIDYFGRGPSDPADDTALEFVADPGAPLAARTPKNLEIEVRGTGGYGVESTSVGADFDASVTFKYKAVEAWTPMLSFSLRGTELLEESRGGSGDVSLRVTPKLCEVKREASNFNCYAQVKATGLGDDFGGSADLGVKFRRATAPRFDVSLSAGPRTGEAGWGYGTRIAAGYGYLFPRGMLLSLTASMTASAKNLIAPTTKAGAELVFKPNTRLNLGLTAQQPVFAPERPIEVGGWLAYVF
ncbi:hypothetical protein [Pyxidicoccus sp. MSG2]|uniref:hypothetical protein n=1 Tax=Pyxidicoccus sp. MSG2 TaxID=2996790 RepID=UPI00226D4AAD|nr:hypothetical protein [Pyxidicoccus sp. MSG2]MCY1015889.1 hypothetical protein [Pyxidicoccus sp. MSG2]